MKIRLKELKTKTSFEIDPVNTSVNPACHPLIMVTVFHLGEKLGDTKPKIISTYAGHMTAMDAGVYSEALMLASFVCYQIEQGESLRNIYLKLSQMESNKAKNTYQTFGRKFAAADNLKVVH